MLPPIEQLQQAPWWSAAAESLGIGSNKFAPFLFTVSPQGRDTILAAHPIKESFACDLASKCDSDGQNIAGV